MHKRILVPIDHGTPSASALREAIDIARAFGAVLCLLHVRDEDPACDSLAPAAALQESQSRSAAREMALLYEARLVAEHSDVPSTARLRSIGSGRVADQVLLELVESNCDLIVMGTHGRQGAPRLFLGSDAELVARRSEVPVVLVKDRIERATNH